MDTLELDRAELEDLTLLLNEVDEGFDDLESSVTLHRAVVYAHSMPARVRSAFNEFRLGQLSGVLRVTGYQVDQKRLGPTPSHWRDRPVPSTARREELLLVLFSSLLGDPFCWATQQDGRLIHDILPIKGHENEPLGSSSESLLTWHTEDAFHPLRGDFISFACLRNPYEAATTIGYVDSLDLPDEVKAVLFQERFSIRPDESHLAKNNSEDDNEKFEHINKRWVNPDRMAVLFGDPGQPYIRADPYFMTVGSEDEEARSALDQLVTQMDKQMFDLQLESGDFCFLDNFRVVHGRKPFRPRHDGTDRWLKRLNISCDLRKSRAARLAGTRQVRLPGACGQTVHSACVGDRRAARMAGSSPARAPMTTAAARPPAHACVGMTTPSPWPRA
jgi:Fe(II)/alpha-ketoglutarate-dependent arginine beta-hydroxylase